MRCKNCGNVIQDSSGRCPYCGRYENKKSRSRIIIMSAVAAMIIISVVFTGIVIKYLTVRLPDYVGFYMKKRYKGAEADYTPAPAEIDWTDVNVYLDFVDDHISQGDFETALEYAQKGYGATGDERLKDIEEMITGGGNIYDSLGRTIRVTGYDREGNINWQHIFTYNQKELWYDPVSVTAYDAHGGETGRIELTYDRENFLNINSYYMLDSTTGEIGLIKYFYPDEHTTKAEWYLDPKGKELGWYYITEFDENWHLVRDEWYDEDGVLYEYGVAEYDESGKPVKKNWYGSDEAGEEFVLSSYTIKEYDENDNLVKEESYDRDGNLLGFYISEYDDSGREIKYESYDGSGVLEYYTVYDNSEDIKGLGIKHYDGEGNFIYEE